MKLIKAENYLCFFALVETILKDIGICNWDQFAISNEFDIVVPFDYSGPITNAQFSDNALEIGAHIDLIGVNKFFYGIGTYYQCKFFSWNIISEMTFVEVIKDELDLGNYLIITFSYGDLYKKHNLDEVGHSGLILAVKENYIQMYDPGPKGCGVKNVRCFDLFDAMRKKQGGIYSFYRVN